MTGKVDAVLSALAANRAFAEELKRSLDALDAEEKQIQTAVQALRQRRALRRAERAMRAFGWDATAPSGADGVGADVFVRESESRYKRVGDTPRSFIRKKPSFFYSAPEKPEKPAKRVRDRRKKRLPLPSSAPPVVDLAKEPEPLPNLDALWLRLHSHEAFVATPAKVFTPKEREVVRRFAQQHAPDGDLAREIPLDTWNLIAQVTKPPIHRTGFACKLWWELHENPTVRRAAWTKEEDKALKALAADPGLTNNWTEIARRMPIPGRPPVHCLTRYMTRLCASNLNDKFTPEEDEMLRRAVDVFGEKWTIIADLMDGRIAEQLRHRWQLSLSPHVKLGKFSVMEDRRLLLALYAYYDRDEAFHRDAVQWQQICHHLAGRPPPPVRDRFLMSINPDVTFREWTPAEDEVVRSTVETYGFDLPGLWPRIAAQLGNRTDNQVSRRARTLLAKEYKEYREAKERAGGDRTTLPTIFARMSTGRRDGRVAGVYEKRSSYNGDEHRSGEDVEEDTAEEEGEEEGEGGAATDGVVELSEV